MIPWWGFALYVSFGNALRSNVNHHYKIDGVRARLWSSLFSFIILSPALFFAKWPQSVEFYLSLAVGCVLVSTLSIKLLDVSARYGGPVATLSRPFHVILSFIFWGMVAWDDTLALLSDKWVLIGVATSFLMATGAQFWMSRNQADIKSALKELLQVAVMGAFMSVVIKYGMIFTNGIWEVMLWVCLTQAGVACIAFTRSLIRHPASEIPLKRLVSAGFVMGMMNAAVVPAMAMSLRGTPNPAFTSMIFMLSTVWLMIYYKIKGQNARVKVWPVVILLLAAIILIVSTSKL